MSKWARLHLGNGTFEGHTLLSPATVSYLHASRTTMFSNGPSTTSYALGWANDTRGSGPVFWHNGGTYGMHAMVALYPSVNVGLVVLTNTDPNSIPEKMVTRLYELLFPGTPPPATAEAAATAVTAAAETDLTAAAAMLQPPAQGRLPKSAVPRNVGEPPDPAGEAAPLPLSRYTGSYRNPAFGRVTVQERSGALVLTIGPKRIEMPMEQFAGSFFALTLPDWPQWVTSVRFVVPSGGHATRFQVEKFSYASGGWFEWMAP